MKLFIGLMLLFTALFLMLLVLVQRGRGGGLSGALGGMGGQSAFGTKAGDMFTRVTMVVATVWILLCIVSIKVLNSQVSKFGTPTSPAGLSAPADGTSEDGETVPDGDSTPASGDSTN